ncbi:MAG: extracellular solute-binding protein [Rhizobiales bacterium]|nr:extracellular solute-binding protein [Hyphomicrobiales bacterium]
MVAALLTPCPTPAAAGGEINLYSSRHYDTDERLYSEFEAATGIRVNRIEDNGGALMKRMQAEGANSPADVFLTTDAGNLWIADQKGLFQPIRSAALETAIPTHLRHPQGHWFGLSLRARVIFHDKARVPNPPRTYEELADPRFKGLVCTRSSSNIYMLSLMAAMIDHLGEEKAKAWAAGVWANRARDPEGGDTDQLRAIASGACGIAISNTYYFARALRTEVKDLSGRTDGIGLVFPNQSDRGTHVNISGGGVLKNAPNRENAIRFLEYLVSDAAQEYFANGNDEYPVVTGVAQSASVKSLGEFKSDVLALTTLGANQTRAQQIYDEVGYK